MSLTLAELEGGASPTFPSFGGGSGRAGDAAQHGSWFASPKLLAYKPAQNVIASSAAQSVHISDLGTPVGGDSLSSSSMSFAEDPAHPIARKVDFVDKSTADASVNASRRSSSDAVAPAVPDAAEDRAKRLAAWKEQKEQKQRGAVRPSATAARGKAPGKDVAKVAAKDRGKEKEGAQKSPEVAGKRRRSRESPSRRRSPQAQEVSVPLSVQPKATPLLERLVRDGQASGALPGGAGGSPSFASFGGQALDDEMPPSPSFPSFASFASRSAVNFPTPSATPSKGLLSASTASGTLPASTPVKFAAFGAAAAAVPAQGPTASTPLSSLASLRTAASTATKKKSGKNEATSSPNLSAPPPGAGAAAASTSSSRRPQTAAAMDDAGACGEMAARAGKAGSGVQVKAGGGAVGGRREVAAVMPSMPVVEAAAATTGVDAPAGRRGAVSGEVKRAVVGEGARSKEEAEVLEAEYETLCARLLQWRYARTRAETAFAAREGLALNVLEALWLSVAREQDYLAAQRLSLHSSQLLSTYMNGLNTQDQALNGLMRPQDSSSSPWLSFQDKYAKVSDAAEAADKLLWIVGCGEGEGEEARSPDADALVACFEACRAWLEKSQDARDEPLVAGTKALRNALLEVASHDEAAREELSQCQLLLHSLQGLQMEERSLRAGEIQFARRS